MRKNIVLFSFDDCIAFWRYSTLFGVKLQTPNLDRLRAVSTTFSAAYCQSPLCGPSRASFMSGRAPHDTWILDNKTKAFTVLKPEDIWSYQLKANGYFCSSGGKVHHGYVPLPDEIHAALYSDHKKFFPRDLRLRPEVKRRALGGTGGGYGTLDPEDDQGYYDAQSARSFIEFLDGYSGDAPFYREVGFFSPHTPFITPLRFKQLYRAADIAYPEEWNEELKEDGAHFDGVRVNFRTYDKPYWQKSVRNYFSAVSHGDYQLGLVWDALQASKYAENTIMVLLTDHGLHLGEKRRFGKSTLLEQIANVPFIIHDPASPKAQTIDDPVALIDVGPTLMDMVGLPAPANSLGLSLMPLLEGKLEGTNQLRDRAVPTLQIDGATIRKGRYRFTRTQAGTAAVYDLENDWWQRRPHGMEHPAFAELSEAHHAACAAYSANFDDVRFQR